MKDVPVVPIDEKLLQATVKLNTLLFAGVSGLMAGLTLLCLTFVSIYLESPGREHVLDLLGVFLPGYHVSFEGAWIGSLWGGLLGAISGAVLYRLYARSIRRQVYEYFAGDKTAESLEQSVLTIYGHPLGVALGGVAALGLLIATNWLVFRGTAEASTHAALLTHYLPGYSVSPWGSLVGAVELFLIAYLSCLLLGAIYNRIVAFRQRRAAA